MHVKNLNIHEIFVSFNMKICLKRKVKITIIMMYIVHQTSKFDLKKKKKSFKHFSLNFQIKNNKTILIRYVYTGRALLVLDN